MLYALTAMTHGETTQQAVAARELHRIITEAPERDVIASTIGALEPVAAVLWDHDPRTAYLLAVVHGRTWVTLSLHPTDLAAGLDPATVAEVDEQARTMDTDQAVAVALDALERYLAAIDPDRVTASESAR